jgi:regulatory protein
MPDLITKRCEMAAINLLARKEYSQAALEEKLKLKGYHNAIVAKILLKLKENGLQSDERFASCYARSRIERGCGPIRIQYELQNYGIPAEIIAQVIEEHKEDWIEIAEKIKAKKFGNKASTSSAEQIKQKKFLLYKGFDFETIKKATND